MRYYIQLEVGLENHLSSWTGLTFTGAVFVLFP